MMSKLSQHVVALLAAAAMHSALLGVKNANAQARPPVVGTAFAVRAPTYTNNLNPTTLHDLETAIGEQLSKMEQRYFKFLRWTSVETTVAAKLIISLLEEPHPLGVRILLSYEATVAGQNVDLPDIPDKVLYDAFDDHNAHAPTVLRRDVLDALDVQFANQDFRLRLQKQFLKTIPLTHSIFVDAKGQRLVVPIPWDSLRASDHSVLLVKFTAAPPSTARQLGTIRIVPDTRAAFGGEHGLIRATVSFYSFPPHLVKQWHPDIPTVLGHVVGDTLAVFMEAYDQDTSPSGTSGRLVTDPN